MILPTEVVQPGGGGVAGAKTDDALVYWLGIIIGEGKNAAALVELL